LATGRCPIDLGAQRQANNLQWMDFDASRLLIPSNSPFQLVLEPSPDVAMSRQTPAPDFTAR